MKLSNIQNNDKLVRKRGLAVLCASIVSTDGILSVPLQLGTKLFLLGASVISPGLESWTQPLSEIDAEFTNDVLKYVNLKSLGNF